MTTDLNLSELDALIAKYDDPRGPDHVQLDRMVTSELLPIWPALRERLAAAEADRAELLEWRRRASEEVRADMRADSDLASALGEAQAELERLRAIVAAADTLHDAFERWYDVASGRVPSDLDLWDAPGGVGDAERAYREARGKR